MFAISTQRVGARSLLAIVGFLALFNGNQLSSAAGQEKLAQRADAKITAAIDALGDDRPQQRERASRTLEALGIRAASQLLQRRLDPDPQRRQRIAELLRKAYRFEIPSFSLQNATLGDACERLTDVCGVRVRAQGEAERPITLDMKNITFWEAVLEICRRGRVGLAPHSTGGGEWPLTGHLAQWVPGTVSGKHPVVLGAEYPRPRNAYVDGPVLVLLSARPIHGERALVLGMQVRYVPDLPVRAMTKPPIRDVRDHER